MSDKCYLCENDLTDDDWLRVPVGFIDAGIVICLDCERKIERKSHKGFRIPDGHRPRPAFSEKQAHAFFARELPGVRCVYDFSEEPANRGPRNPGELPWDRGYKIRRSFSDSEAEKFVADNHFHIEAEYEYAA